MSPCSILKISTYIINGTIAVVVADSHQSQARRVSGSDPSHVKIIPLQTYEPSVGNLWHETVLDSVDDEFTQPHERSMFDAAVNAYKDLSLEIMDDPFSATHLVRNCIRAAWEQMIWRDEHQVSRHLTQNVWHHRISHRVPPLEDFENKMAIDNEAMMDYQTLMRLQESARHNRYILQLILYKFRLRDTRCLSVKTPEFHNHMAEEAESWKFLDAKLQYIEESLTNHTKMYYDRSAMEETYEAKMQSRESMRQTKETAAANRMARSSGQLTKIATIIVPCTFVTSIFSMGGDFAAGESLFYVYWIISVPITLGLLFWIIHEDIVDAVQKPKKWMNSRKTKLSEKSQA